MSRLEPIRDQFDAWSARRLLPTAEEIRAEDEERERRRVERHNRKIARLAVRARSAERAPTSEAAS